MTHFYATEGESAAGVSLLTILLIINDKFDGYLIS